MSRPTRRSPAGAAAGAEGATAALAGPTAPLAGPTPTLAGSAPAAAHGTPAGDHEIPAYPDLAYRDVFWAGRHYEDRADRIAIRRLLPPTGGRIVEIGAGYGRLANEYRGYHEIVLLDASEAHVEAARAQFADEPRISAVLGDAYHMPLEDGRFDTVVCVRVVHHLTDPGAVFREFARILRPDGVLVLEFANKRHLKAIAKYALRRQDWSPHTLEPFEYRPLHFDRHPVEVRRLLRKSGFAVERQLTASLFRFPAVSRHVGPGWLAAIERPLQPLLGPFTPGPSVFLRARKTG